MMRMLDMSSNGGGGYQPRSSSSPLSRGPPSPLASPHQTSPPPRPAPPLHLALPPHMAGKQETSHSMTSSSGPPPFPPPIPLFSSSQPDPFAALQDLRLSY